MQNADGPWEPDAFGTGRVLGLIRERDATTRAELVRETGLSRSTLAKRVQDLLQLDLVREVEGRASTGGRPPATIVFNPRAGYVLAADVGQSRTRVAVCDLGGELCAERTIASGAPESMRAVLDELLAAAGVDGAAVRGVGVGLAPGWEGFPSVWKDEVPTLVESQVNTMALGEHRAHWREVEHLVYFDVSATVGCGIVTGRRIHRGAHGSAGDIAHVRVPGYEHVVCRCGDRGCLDAVASADALASRLGVAGVSEVMALLRAGDAEALRAVQDAGRALGAVLALCINLFNPGAIVIGGDLAEAHHHLLAGIREVAFARSLPMATRELRMSRGRLGDRAGLIGAAVMVADHVLAPDSVDAMAH
ncbi:MAG TPA: ROK family transcriptional regulator [Solirubrobacter sp.]|nr:ROK family transcriptional regulator [Solirubrobacter sp.]